MHHPLWKHAKSLSLSICIQIYVKLCIILFTDDKWKITLFFFQAAKLRYVNLEKQYSEICREMKVAENPFVSRVLKEMKLDNEA